jgi:hypothetical protein
MRNTNSEIEKHLVLDLRRITVALQRLNDFYDAERPALPPVLPGLSPVLPELKVQSGTATPKLRPNRGRGESGFAPGRTTDDS